MKSRNSYSLHFESMKENWKLKISSVITKIFLKDYSVISPELSDLINEITENTIINLEKWINDDKPQKYKKFIFDAIEKENWIEIINAFYQELNFGTSGIRGKLTGSLNDSDSEKDLHLIQKKKSDSDILTGPNSTLR